MVFLVTSRHPYITAARCLLRLAPNVAMYIMYLYFLLNCGYASAAINFTIFHVCPWVLVYSLGNNKYVYTHMYVCMYILFSGKVWLCKCLENSLKNFSKTFSLYSIHTYMYVCAYVCSCVIQRIMNYV